MTGLMRVLGVVLAAVFGWLAGSVVGLVATFILLAVAGEGAGMHALTLMALCQIASAAGAAAWMGWQLGNRT